MKNSILISLEKSFFLDRNDSRFLDTNWCGDGPRSCAGEKAPAMFLPGVELYSYLFKSGKEWGLSHESS